MAGFRKPRLCAHGCQELHTHDGPYIGDMRRYHVRHLAFPLQFALCLLSSGAAFAVAQTAYYFRWACTPTNSVDSARRVPRKSVEAISGQRHAIHAHATLSVLGDDDEQVI